MGSMEDDRKKRAPEQGDGISPAGKKKNVSLEDVLHNEQEMLMYRNRKQAQEIMARRLEIDDLNFELESLRQKQSKYDETLMIVNRTWNQLIEDLEIVASQTFCKLEAATIHSSEENGSACTGPPEDTFLQQLIEAGYLETSDAGNESTVEERIELSLRKRRKKTEKLLSHILSAIQKQRQRNDEQLNWLKQNLHSPESSKILLEREEILSQQLTQQRVVLEEAQIRLKKASSENLELKDKEMLRESELQRLRNQLDDVMMKVDSLRRKVVASGEKDRFVVPPPRPIKIEVGINGVEGEKTKPREEPKKSEPMDEVLEEAQRKQLSLMERISALELELSEEKRLQSTRPMAILNDQINLLRSEITRLRAILEQVQRERDLAVLREKEMSFKAEAGEAARRAYQTAEGRIRELEGRLRDCNLERDAFEQRLEQTERPSGSEDTVEELKAMVSTLRAEMGVLHSSLGRFKEAAAECATLKASVQSLSSVLSRKNEEMEELKSRLSQQAEKIAALENERESLKDSEHDLKLFLEMFERESVDPRDIQELKQAERRALAQIERLRLNLDEHALTMKAKAANEAQAQCQLQLASTEEKILELRAQLDFSEREIIELKETLQSKNEEGETYLSEIETIGQAYNDMQAQNRRLLQQVMDRDDYNTKLLSESVQSKQAQNSAMAEREALALQVHTLSASVQESSARLVRMEEQLKAQLEQLGAASEELRQLTMVAESARARQQQAEHELQVAKLELQEANHEVLERGKKLLELQGMVDKESVIRRKGEEDVVKRTGEITSVQKVQEELDLYKRYLRCPVCEEGTKEVIIAKCFHLFCDKCIKRSLEARNRKCPACKVGFGQSDVRRVFY